MAHLNSTPYNMQSQHKNTQIFHPLGFLLFFPMCRAIMGVSKRFGRSAKMTMKREWDAMERHKILLVEDDAEISEMLKNYLETENYEVVCAFDGEEACKKFDSVHFHLVLLDLMIPKIGGMEVLGHIRQKSNVPIIIVSAKDTDADKTLGLGLGADDYITKPFSVTEVLARIRAQIRRNTRYSSPAEEKPETIKAGELTLSLDNYTVTKKGVSLGLTAKEFEILRLLMENPKKVYTKEQIYSKVWNDAYLGDENAVNVHISRLRNKIEDEPGKPKYVVTVWGIGYKFGEIHE